MLAHALHVHPCMGFVGSGMSAQKHYPSWGELALGVANDASKQSPSGLSTIESELLEDNRGVLKAACEAGGVVPAELIFTTYDLAKKCYADGVLFKKAVVGRLDELRRESLNQSKGGDAPTLGDTAEGGGCRSACPDPFVTVIEELGLERFVTTNYDMELEDALKRVLDRPKRTVSSDDAPTFDPPRAAFCSLAPDCDDALTSAHFALFATGAPEYERGVFHCHGHVERPDTMVVTERDYQEAYLSRQPGRRTYRESLELAFASNAVLFLGVGLSEVDLLRPLRQFVTDAPGDASRPLFALLESRGRKGAQLERERRHLLGQYGLKVLYYQTEERPLLLERRKAFVHAVRALGEYSTWWWQNWRKRPLVREPPLARKGEKLLVHHKIAVQDIGRTAPAPGSEPKEDALLAAVRPGPSPLTARQGRLVLLLGPNGAGKGARAAAVAEHFGEEGDGAEGGFHRVFFARAHFANEIHAALEAAARHFLGQAVPEDQGTSLHDTLLQALTQKEKPCLLVLGGVERLLREREWPDTDPQRPRQVSRVEVDNGKGVPVGRPASANADRLFETLARAAQLGPSRIVLATSLFPESLEAYLSQGWLVRVASRGQAKDAFVSVAWDAISERSPKVEATGAEDAGLAQAHITELLGDLHYAFRSHSFALKLTVSVLKKQPERPQAAWVKWLDALFLGVTRRPFGERASFMVREALRCMREESQGRDQVAENGSTPFHRKLVLLHRIAMVTTPVGCHEIAVIAAVSHRDCQSSVVDADVAGDLENLHEWGLLEKVGPPQGEDAAGERYTVHSIVRQYVFPPGPSQRFVHPGFAEHGDEVQEQLLADHNLAGKCFDELVAKAHASIGGGSAKGQTDSPATDGDQAGEKKTRPLLRAAFGLARARWNAVGLTRVPEDPNSDLFAPRYDAYLRRLSSLANAVRAAHPAKLWRYSADRVRNVYESKDGVLYVDELGWAANELALVSFIRGSMGDAHAWFKAGEHISAVAEHRTHGRRWCQSEMNVGVVQMERGKVSTARSHLVRAHDGAVRNEDSEMAARAEGYLGLVAHLGGDVDKASGLYARAIGTLSVVGNYRALSIFHKMASDLHRACGHKDKAERSIEAAIAAAEMGRHADLLHHARIAQANQASRPHTAESASALAAARKFAATVGIPKLEVDACKVIAAHALDAGDHDRAARSVVHALGLATLHGMGLHVTGCLMLMGDVARARGEPGQARAIYESVRLLGREQGYLVQAEQAHRRILGLRLGAVSLPEYGRSPTS